MIVREKKTLSVIKNNMQWMRIFAIFEFLEPVLLGVPRRIDDNIFNFRKLCTRYEYTCESGVRKCRSKVCGERHYRKSNVQTVGKYRKRSFSTNYDGPEKWRRRRRRRDNTIDKYKRFSCTRRTPIIFISSAVVVLVVIIVVKVYCRSFIRNLTARPVAIVYISSVDEKTR